MGETPITKPESIVSMYSTQLEGRIPPEGPAYRLSVAVVEDRSSLQSLVNPWGHLLQPATLTESGQNAITAVIADESERLCKIWTRFQELSRPEDRLDLDTTSPTMESITKLVSQGMQSWKDGRKSGRQGTVTTKFHKFCNAVDSHKTLLKVLPESHEYFNIFTGSVTALIKASLTHEAVVESLSNALEDMTDLIQDAERDLMLFPDEEMTSKVVDP